MTRLLFAFLTVLSVAPSAFGADTWKEVKSAHFTMWSTTDDGGSRELLWQMEQIRSAMGMIWPWMRLDLGRPFVVIVVKDGKGMKAIAPAFFEPGSNINPGSVWLWAPDRLYVALRADVRGNDHALENPYQSTYFSYSSVVLGNSFDTEIPLWFHRGLAGVLSNTIVRKDHVALGAPIANSLKELRTAGRLHLADLVGTKSLAGFDGTRLFRYDAQAWAFVHMLMFGENGGYRDRLNRFVALLRSGREGGAAFQEALGPVEPYEGPFANYLKNQLIQYARVAVDAGVNGEAFPIRVMTPAESATSLAAFHAGMMRPVEARALIEAARKVEPESGDAYAAEGLVLEREDKLDEARTAFAKAAERQTTNAYALYRMATLSWQGAQPDADTLGRMEKALERAIGLNTGYAAAYSYIARVRSALGQPEAGTVPFVRRAIALEPADPWHRIIAAGILANLGRQGEAREEAQKALTLASDDERARAEAQRILGRLK